MKGQNNDATKSGKKCITIGQEFSSLNNCHGQGTGLPCFPNEYLVVVYEIAYATKYLGLSGGLIASVRPLQLKHWLKHFRPFLLCRMI